MSFLLCSEERFFEFIYHFVRFFIMSRRSSAKERFRRLSRYKPVNFLDTKLVVKNGNIKPMPAENFRDIWDYYDEDGQN